MESGPLPPHERTWRHPSELAADHRAALASERPSATARAAALLTGAAGVALVGLAVFALTPRGTEAPLAVGSVPTPGPTPAPTSTFAPDDGAPDLTAPTAVRAREPLASALPLVIPVQTTAGSAHLAVAPSRTVSAHVDAQLGGHPDAEHDPRRDHDLDAQVQVRTMHTVITVRYPDGTTTPAVIVDPGRGQGFALLEVADSSGQPTYPVARWMPEADDLVTVLSDEPIVVPFEQVHELDADGGVAIVNEQGHLIGMCEPGSPGEFIGVDVLFADATEPAD